jgi:Acyl-CoA carboxylase epsilon subunit
VSEPLFHVKRGHPTPEELAALTAVLAAKLRAATAARSRRHSAGPPPWGAPAAAHRRPLPAPGPGAWKRAAWGGAVGGAGAAGGAGIAMGRGTAVGPGAAGGLGTAGVRGVAGGADA